MSRITQTQYDKMIQSHRDAPGQISAAARAAVVSRRTASKYWNTGGDEAWMEPIRRVLEREQSAARARLERERVQAAGTRGIELGKQEAEDARADLGRELAETAKLARSAKSNALDLLGIVQAITEGAKTIEQELRAAFDSGAIRDLVKCKPSEAIKLVRELARLVHDGNLAAETAVKLERLMLGHGAPGEVHLHVETADEALAIIGRANAAASRARGESAPVLPAKLPDPTVRH